MKKKVETLGLRLRHARELSGYSQLEVEKITGINNANISKYELDQTSPGLETLKKLADTYGVSLDWIFGITDKPDRIISKELQDLGFEWVSVIDKCRASGLTPEQVKNLIDAIDAVNRKKP
jgi:transcriptional regulator with XRE-family HTH domain